MLVLYSLRAADEIAFMLATLLVVYFGNKCANADVDKFLLY